MFIFNLQTLIKQLTPAKIHAITSISTVSKPLPENLKHHISLSFFTIEMCQGTYLCFVYTIKLNGYFEIVVEKSE